MGPLRFKSAVLESELPRSAMSVPIEKIMSSYVLNFGSPGFSQPPRLLTFTQPVVCYLPLVISRKDFEQFILCFCSANTIMSISFGHASGTCCNITAPFQLFLGDFELCACVFCSLLSLLFQQQKFQRLLIHIGGDRFSGRLSNTVPRPFSLDPRFSFTAGVSHAEPGSSANRSLTGDPLKSEGNVQCYLVMIGARIALNTAPRLYSRDPYFSFVVGVSHVKRCSGASKVLTVFLSLQSCIIAGEAANFSKRWRNFSMEKFLHG